MDIRSVTWNVRSPYNAVTKMDRQGYRAGRCGLDTSASSRSQQWSLVNTVMELRGPQKVENFLVSSVTISFSRTLVHGISQLVDRSVRWKTAKFSSI